jgi:quinol monooxygenase YgiN
MKNRHGLFRRLQARAGNGKQLGEILLNAARLMENARGCVFDLVSMTAEDPDAIYVFDVWDSNADYDDSLTLPGVCELIQHARSILDGRPEGATLHVLDGRGLGLSRRTERETTSALYPRRQATRIASQLNRRARKRSPSG